MESEATTPRDPAHDLQEKVANESNILYARLGVKVRSVRRGSDGEVVVAIDPFTEEAKATMNKWYGSRLVVVPGGGGSEGWFAYDPGAGVEPGR